MLSTVKRRWYIMLLTVIMVLSSAISSFAAVDFNPTLISFGPQVSITPSQTEPNGDITGGTAVTVTISFKDTMARAVPFEIELTNSAIFNAVSAQDVVINSGGNPVGLQQFQLNSKNNKMTLLTQNVTRNATTTITFDITAPISRSDFQVIVHNDSIFGTTESPKYAVFALLTIDAPLIVDDVNPFDITGIVNVDPIPPNSYVFVEIVDPNDPDNRYFMESQGFSRVNNPGDRYTINGLVLDQNAMDLPDGEYLIRAYLVDGTNGDNIIVAEREITFVRRKNVLFVRLETIDAHFDQKDDPEPNQGAQLRGGLSSSGHNISPQIIATAKLKYIEEVLQADNLELWAYNWWSGGGWQRFDAFKSQTADGRGAFVGTIGGTRDGVPVAFRSGGGNDSAFFRYTLDGVAKEIFVGNFEVPGDPSGMVYDAETGDPIVGATVTLYRKNDSGMFVEWVPPFDQINPMTTDENGRYRWDVENGIYEVRVYHPDYNTKDFQYSSLLDPAYGPIEVPPERDDIHIALHKMPSARTRAIVPGYPANGITAEAPKPEADLTEPNTEEPAETPAIIPETEGESVEASDTEPSDAETSGTEPSDTTPEVTEAGEAE